MTTGLRIGLTVLFLSQVVPLPTPVPRAMLGPQPALAGTHKVIGVETSGIDGIKGLEKEERDALKQCVLDEIKANFEDALTGGNTIEVTDGVRTGAKGQKIYWKCYLKKKSKKYKGRYVRGQWPASGKRTTSYVYIGSIIRDSERHNYEKNEPPVWDTDKLCNAIAKVACHEIAHMFSCVHDTLEPPTKMTEGGRVDGEDLANNDWEFGDDCKDTINKNWGRKKQGCPGSGEIGFEFAAPRPYDLDALPNDPEDGDYFESDFEFTGAVADQFDFGWIGEDTDTDNVDGYADIDFIYKSSMEGDTTDAHMMTFLENPHAVIQFALRGQAGSGHDSVIYRMRDGDLLPGGLITRPDGEQVYRQLTLEWDVDSIAGADVEVVLTAVDASRPHGSDYSGWQVFGPNPTGACCTGLTGLCIEDATYEECADAGGRWLLDTPCNPDPFSPPCGTSACCLPGGSCQNLTLADCAMQGGESYPGMVCEEPDFTCPHPACIDNIEICDSTHQAPGCGNRPCCELVCDQMPSCCEGEWTADCADIAQRLCVDPVCGAHVSRPCSEADTTDPGCHNLTVCEWVCSVDPYCCDVMWDSLCVEIAMAGGYSDLVAGADTERFGPGDSVLGRPSPNPFRGKTGITYAAEVGGRVSIEVYDVRGRSVKTLVRQVVKPGRYTAAWDGTTDEGHTAADGIYFIRMASPAGAATRKIVLRR